MKEDDLQLVKLLETRVRQLILRNKELRQQNAQLWQQAQAFEILGRVPFLR